MPNPWYPPAVHRPGTNAENGHTTMESAVCHFTVGRDSRPIGDRGFFHFLVSRDGTVTQFARADAICWHAGDPWNARGPGVEVEYLPGADDDIFTPEADHAAGLLVQWLEDEWGIPAEFYDGERRRDWHGFITHRSLIQTGDLHSDWWPYLPTPSAAPEPEKEDRMQPELMADEQGVVWVYDANAHTKTRVDGPATLNALTAVWSLHGVPTKIADSGAARDILKGAVEIR